MDPSRRNFVTTGLAGLAALYVAEDGLARSRDARCSRQSRRRTAIGCGCGTASPGREAAARYSRSVRRVLVEGESATARITRQELTTALGEMLGAPIASAAPMATAPSWWARR